MGVGGVGGGGDVLRAAGPMKSKETRKKIHQHQAGCRALMPERRMLTDKVVFENPLVVWGAAIIEKRLEKTGRREEEQLKKHRGLNEENTKPKFETNR